MLKSYNLIRRSCNEPTKLRMTVKISRDLRMPWVETEKFNKFINHNTRLDMNLLGQLELVRMLAFQNIVRNSVAARIDWNSMHWCSVGVKTEQQMVEVAGSHIVQSAQGSQVVEIIIAVAENAA